MRRSTEERQARKIAWREQDARLAAQYAEMAAHVERGTCPDCGAPLRRNLSLTGWWQCSQLGSVGFRADANKPPCDFQGFTAPFPKRS